MKIETDPKEILKEKNDFDGYFNEIEPHLTICQMKKAAYLEGYKDALFQIGYAISEWDFNGNGED